MLDVEADAGFWMSVDAEEGTQADWISISTITSTVKAMSAKHVMVVSDSCYSGRLTRGSTVSLQTGSEREDELRRLSSMRSRTALVSGGLEPVADGGGEGHSVFTRAFLTALRESNNVMDGNQLFSAIRRPVIVNANQTPEYSDIRLADHDGGDFLFVPANLRLAGIDTGRARREETGQRGISVTGDGNGSGAESAVVNSKKELAFWEAIKDSGDADMFRAYLAQFPSGTFASLATIKIAQIEGATSDERPAQEVEVAVVVPPATDLTFEVEDTDLTLIATANANVRARPATSAERLDTIPAGAEVEVTGKVLGEDWFRVVRADGGEGYVFAPLLRSSPSSADTATADLGEDPVWARSQEQRTVVAQWRRAIDRWMAP